MHTQEFAPPRGGPAVLAIVIHGVLIYGLAIGLGVAPSPLPPLKPIQYFEPLPSKSTVPPPASGPSTSRFVEYLPPLKSPPKPTVISEDPPLPPGDGDNTGSGVVVPPADTTFVNARIVQSFEPTYPGVSINRGEEGTTYVRIELSPDGRILDVRLDRSSGASRLDEAALKAVRTWRFAPATRGGQSVSTWVVVPVKFELRR